MPRPNAKTQERVRKRFAARLYQIRIEREWSMEQMGKRLNVSAPMIVKYEKGRSLPSQETMVMIANTLGMSLDELFGINPGKSSKKKAKK